jgi:fatty-acyl-CoA synthase
MPLLSRLTATVHRSSIEARSLLALVRAGALGTLSPSKQLQIFAAVRDYGPLGGVTRIAALQHGDRIAITDDRGEITFLQLDDRINRLSNALRARGLGPGSSVGILCRNHRAPLVVAFAASRIGMNAVWLNTAFSGRQASEVASREGIDLLVHDDELAEMVAAVNAPGGRIVCSVEDPSTDELDALIDVGDPDKPPPPERPGRIVLLTSGTTGTPKGAPRAEPRSLSIPGALLERMPMRARGVTLIGPPLSHGTGLTLSMLTISLGSELVLRRRFGPHEFLDDLERRRATGACVVPVMLQRMLALGEDEIRSRDLRSLRVIFCAGSQLPAEVATKTMDLLGDVVYNLYGSTEVSVATFATPRDLRAAPTSVGKPALGSQVRVVDEAGVDLPPGRTGRIFVGSTSPFEGYTGGGTKEMIDGLMSTGDVGHFDSEGRLYIDGRDDEMIVSGGENVFPIEVEELLLTHPAIADAAAIGVKDPEFGQRLRACIVKRDGHELTESEVQAFVKENLARFKVPREVVFIDEVPRNPTGKILKRELRAASPG